MNDELHLRMCKKIAQLTKVGSFGETQQQPVAGLTLAEAL